MNPSCRRSGSVPKPDDTALALGIEARELRVAMKLRVTDVAPRHGWSCSRWFDAEQGLGGIDDARRVLDLIQRLRAEREAALIELTELLEAA